VVYNEEAALEAAMVESAQEAMPRRRSGNNPEPLRVYIECPHRAEVAWWEASLPLHPRHGAPTPRISGYLAAAKQPTSPHTRAHETFHMQENTRV
jgi:hypothetical protein